jgi:hypothetical protein
MGQGPMDMMFRPGMMGPMGGRMGPVGMPMPGRGRPMMPPGPPMDEFGRGRGGIMHNRGGFRGGGPPPMMDDAVVNKRRRGLDGFQGHPLGGRGHAMDQGFLKRRGHGSGGRMTNIPHPEILAEINEAVTADTILQLWVDKGNLWLEPHLGQGLLTFAKLVEETCPGDVQKACCCTYSAPCLLQPLAQCYSIRLKW